MTGELSPEERLWRFGPLSLSDTELLSLLVQKEPFCRSRPLDLAHTLLQESGGIVGLLGADRFTVRGFGLNSVSGSNLLAAVELSRRLSRAKLLNRQRLHEPEAVAGYLNLRYSSQDQEVMGALFLDIRHSLVGECEIFRGTLDRAVVEPRKILKEAIRRSAHGLILFHTHPSNDPTPSREDLAFTRRIAKAGDLIGVLLIDHMILGGAGRWVSLQRRCKWRREDSRVVKKGTQ